MKKMIYLSLALATAVCLSGCNTPQGQNAAGGAVIGGATGAVIGGAVSNSAGGALAGGLLGATAGAMIGSAATPQDPGYAPPPRRCAEWGYDYYGNRVCRAFY